MPVRGIHSEEEMLLYFDMLESRGDISLLKDALQGPLLSPLKQFRQGRKEIFLRAVRVLSAAKEWAMVYSLTKDCLSEKDELGRTSLLASDWGVWKSLVEAASHILSTDPEYASLPFHLPFNHVANPHQRHPRGLGAHRLPPLRGEPAPYIREDPDARQGPDLL
ncbi:hypothetical protein IMZ48_24940 [Candidatus Bathyarchaeota archaeon]|nr:hypothetical protein [Candidatus Bathyarchaeota archaeon]